MLATRRRERNERNIQARRSMAMDENASIPGFA
jgi:hypothetical protein